MTSRWIPGRARLLSLCLLALTACGGGADAPSGPSAASSSTVSEIQNGPLAIGAPSSGFGDTLPTLPIPGELLAAAGGRPGTSLASAGGGIGGSGLAGSGTSAAELATTGGIGGSGLTGGGIGGSGVNGGGIGGSGLYSYGRITAFGSIFVNGVEFFLDDPSTRITVRGQVVDQGALKLGMVVRVRGRFSGTGRLQGTAAEVEYDARVLGPVAGPIVTGVDGIERRFSVLGRSVLVDRWATVFDGTDFSTLATGDLVEISGFVDADGLLRATRVAGRPAFVPDVTQVSVDGVVTGWDPIQKTFSIGGLTIDASQADLSSLPAPGIVDGSWVSVSGTLASSSARRISANLVRPVALRLGHDGDEVLLEGIVTAYRSLGDFEVDGQPVDASGAELSPPAVVLAPNTHLSIEGKWANGRIVATHVKVRKIDVSIFAPVAAVDPRNRLVHLAPRAGQPPIPIQLTAASQLTDEVAGVRPFTIADIAVGDFLLVQGIDTGAGVPLMAVQLDRVAPKDVLVEGIVDAIDVAASTITVRGVRMPIAPTTVMRDLSGVVLPSLTDFAAKVRVGTTVVRIVDKAPTDGVNDTLSILIP